MTRHALLAIAALLAAGCPGGTFTAEPTDTPDASYDEEDPEQTCGDGVCSLDDGEHCQSCQADCGACGVCGDGRCELQVESCEDCPQDCGTCAVCGDGVCDEPAGEDCATCGGDCGACPGCGDGVCDGAAGEACDSCPTDCGACDPCGDGECDGAGGEDCASCAEDCGACDPCGDGECDPDRETCETCAADCGGCSTSRPGCIQGTFKPYWGNLHAHTHYSDGQGTPAQAFAHARAAGLDFMWISDHRGRLTREEWDACRSQASTANEPDVFAAGCGYEYGIESTSGTNRGHLNVLFTARLMPRPVGLKPLYEALAGCSPCVGQWNHPPWPGTFLDYRHYAVGQDAMRLIEFSGRGDWADKWNAYFTALRKGWRVSPSANEDNHSRNWGDSKRATGAWATGLSRNALRAAVRGRRTFATFDDTAWIRLEADDGCFMGSVLRGLGETTLTVVARDRQSRDGFRRIDLYGPSGEVLAGRRCDGANPCRVTFRRNVTGATFFVAKATQADGDRLISAPIWFEP